MEGSKLSCGEYDKRPISDDEMWSAFATLFSSKSRKDTTYKYGFLKSIIDNLYNIDSNYMLTFDQLFSKFGEVYWNLVLKYGLRQKAVTENRSNGSYLEQILNEAAVKYNIIEPIPYESLTQDMMDDIAKKVKQKCKNNVVGALYGDTNQLFYSFSKKEEWIQINPIMYEFLCKHKVAIEKLNYYEWAKFLEKVNEDNAIVRLLDKLESSAKRNNLSVYRQILFDEFESKNCFYCGKALRSDKIDVDHFVPWSFVKDDNLWNLVLACPACNRSKNDRLPSGRFLSRIIKRNESLLLETKRPDLEGFKERIENVYKWASVNGYASTWEPKVSGL